jgi:biopolymer transport protein ExbB
MSNSKKAGGFSSLVASLTIAIAVVIGFIIYTKIFGNPANFEERDITKEPLNTLGTIHKGGMIVPFLLAVNITVVIFIFERFITLSMAKGKGNINKFVNKIKGLVQSNDISSAIEECDKQKGSLANVVRAGLEKYEAISTDTSLDKEKKVELLKTELEEATALELPMLSKNLVIISTCATIGTLIGLIGTVLGMIKSFQAMSSGAPDPGQLAVGISEALINTALGIGASTLAIIFYNIFTTKIDQMTHSMDEAGFSIVQNFNATQK